MLTGAGRELSLALQELQGTAATPSGSISLIALLQRSGRTITKVRSSLPLYKALTENVITASECVQ